MWTKIENCCQKFYDWSCRWDSFQVTEKSENLRLSAIHIRPNFFFREILSGRKTQFKKVMRLRKFLRWDFIDLITLKSNKVHEFNFTQVPTTFFIRKIQLRIASRKTDLFSINTRILRTFEIFFYFLRCTTFLSLKILSAFSSRLHQLRWCRIQEITTSYFLKLGEYVINFKIF